MFYIDDHKHSGFDKHTSLLQNIHISDLSCFYSIGPWSQWYKNTAVNYRHCRLNYCSIFITLNLPRNDSKLLWYDRKLPWYFDPRKVGLKLPGQFTLVIYNISPRGQCLSFKTLQIRNVQPMSKFRSKLLLLLPLHWVRQTLIWPRMESVCISETIYFVNSVN